MCRKMWMKNCENEGNQIHNFIMCLWDYVSITINITVRFRFRYGKSYCSSGSATLFWWPEMEKITAGKKFKFFWSKIAIFLSHGLHKGRPSYRRSLQPSKKRTSSTSKHEISSLSPIFVGNFCPPGSGLSRPKSLRIRVRNTGRYRTTLDFAPCWHLSRWSLQYFWMPKTASLGGIHLQILLRK